MKDKFYAKFEATESLDESMLLEIEDFAKGLEFEEMLPYYGDESDFSEYELNWMKKSFNRGRASGMKIAVDRLFTAMSDRNGQNASLPYLRRFAKEWPVEDNIKEGDVLIFKANVG